MAVIKRGVLGGFQNKIANVVGSSWKGISYMRSLPISVANPRTAPQTTQRAKFRNTVAFARLILTTLIKPMWDRFAQYESGYNARVSANIAAFAPTGVDSPALLIIAKGTLAPAALLTTIADASAGTVTLTWDGTPGGDANPDDELYIMFLNLTNNQVEGVATGVARFIGTAAVGLNVQLSVSDNYYVYAAFRKADGTKVSNTQYLTGSVVA